MNPMSRASLSKGGRRGVFSVDVAGAFETETALKKLAPAVQRRLMRPACSNAMTQVVKVARQLAPRSTGTLKKNIIKVQRTTSRGTVITRVGARDITLMVAPKSRKKKRRGRKAGASKRIRKAPKAIRMNPAKYLHLVELGTKAHAIGKGSRSRKGIAIGREHPGAKASHFLQSAWDRRKDFVIHDMSQNLGAGIEREAAKLAAKAKAATA